MDSEYDYEQPANSSNSELRDSNSKKSWIIAALGGVALVAVLWLVFLFTQGNNDPVVVPSTSVSVTVAPPTTKPTVLPTTAPTTGPPATTPTPDETGATDPVDIGAEPATSPSA